MLDDTVIQVAPDDQDFHGSCTFLNMSGDVTIVWDKQNREAMLEAVQAMMAKGYTFFTTKKILIEKFQRRSKVTNKNIEKIDNLILTDEQFNEIVQQIKDPIVADAVQKNNAAVGKRKSKGQIETSKRAESAEEVVDGHSVAIKPVHGG